MRDYQCWWEHNQINWPQNSRLGATGQASVHLKCTPFTSDIDDWGYIKQRSDLLLYQSRKE